MESSLDRRRGRGRRQSDARDELAVHGLLHDLGHQMTTLSYLVEAVRGEAALPEDSGFRMELLSLEMSRLQDIIAREIPGSRDLSAVAPIDLRSLSGQVAQLANVAHETLEVRLLPGPEVVVEASPALLWRVLTNVVDNAARAVRPGGTVEISAAWERDAVIEVTDDGPGFGKGPPGTASLGLPVVRSLLKSIGGQLEVDTPEAGGTRVRIVLPGDPPASQAAGQDTAGHDAGTSGRRR
jgi:signal transduction histidine kinase